MKKFNSLVAASLIAIGGFVAPDSAFARDNDPRAGMSEAECEDVWWKGVELREKADTLRTQGKNELAARCDALAAKYEALYQKANCDVYVS